MQPWEDWVGEGRPGNDPPACTPLGVPVCAPKVEDPVRSRISATCSCTYFRPEAQDVVQMPTEILGNPKGKGNPSSRGCGHPRLRREWTQGLECGAESCFVPGATTVG